MPEPPRFFIGLDPASETFAASVFHRPEEPGLLTAEFANDTGGFEVFVAWLKDHGATSEACIVCVEATGVYAEGLCYYLHEQGFSVALEGPHEVQRAFKTTGNKNDPADSRQIVGDLMRSPSMPSVSSMNCVFGSPKRPSSSKYARCS